MRKFVKLVSLVLAILMLAATFAACKKDDGNSKDTNNDNPKDTVAGTQEGTTEPETTKVPDIEVKNWGGKEYRILGKQHASEYSLHSFEVSREGEEIPEDIVGRAVWERNNDLKDNYGIIVKGTFSTASTTDAVTALDAGEDLYDLLLVAPEAYLNFALKGQLLDLMKLKYINLEHETWTPFINGQFTMGGKMYYTSNKFMLQEKNRSYILYYNRDVAKELKLGHFEDFVFDGTWTIDKVKELGKQATFERDGQPGLGKEDRWGVGVAENYSFSQFALGAGFRFAKMGADGYPELLGPTDQMMAILDKALELFTDKTLFWCDTQYGAIDYNYCADHLFYRGDILIFGGGITNLDYVKQNAEFEFGVLPNAKYDEKQEIYHATPNLGNGSLLGVPAAVSDPEFAGYALEVISEKAVDTSYTAYIETKCKLQDAPDADAAKCFDIIFDGIVYDIGFVNSLGGLSSIITSTLPSGGTNNYNRLYARISKVAEQQINKIRETFPKLEY